MNQLDFIGSSAFPKDAVYMTLHCPRGYREKFTDFPVAETFQHQFDDLFFPLGNSAFIDEVLRNQLAPPGCCIKDELMRKRTNPEDDIVEPEQRKCST